MSFGSPGYEKDSRVDDYIDALPDWQRDICRELRDLIHAADPEVSETIKRSVQPYFVLEGNICALLAAKDHVNLFLYDGGIVPDPSGIITAGHGNKTARQISYYDGARIQAAALTAMLRQIVANNRAGGWRKLKKTSVELMLDVGALRDELDARGARFVAIDGPGGSGKSTLARMLAEHWPTAVVVEMDDFHRPAAERFQQPAAHGAGYDRERLISEVLGPLAAGRAGLYQRYDWEDDRLAGWRRVPADAVVVVEGVYSASEEMRRHFDYTIWVDCPYELRLQRGVQRDGEAMRAVWVREWMPAEERYATAERPAARADLVLDGSGAGVEGVGFTVIRRGRRAPSDRAAG